MKNQLSLLFRLFSKMSTQKVHCFFQGMDSIYIYIDENITHGIRFSTVPF